ncbi:uncharacterized protein LOC123920534 isoform X1 [Trifolium pratense]|uniref:uncharacterized protein LOC123920534 isoform X1 n=1 Tax=Trifolium pratense TaxID=57577 RepID=UPI001E697153|nr:uncharacterized protein LOC123920534 isoform X1 [Trifolium pratense]
MDSSTSQQTTDTVNESLPAIPVVPYDRLFPFLFPHIDQDKVDEIQALFEKYKRDEIIPKSRFFARVTDIVGMQLVYSATMQLHEQQNKNRQVPVNEQFTTQQMSNLQITDTVNELQVLFNMLPYDQDKVDEIQALSEKPRDEQADIVSTFSPLMTDILEEQLVSPSLAQMQEQKSNLQVTVNEQPRTQINSSKVVLTFDQLFHLLAPQIGIEKTIDLYYFGKKCQRGEIPKCNITPLMKDIVGEPAFRSAVATLLRQKSSQQVTVNEQPGTQINSDKKRTNSSGTSL